MKTVVGVFDHVLDAEHAVDELVSRGFELADLTFLSPERALERGGETRSDENTLGERVGMLPMGVPSAHAGMPPSTPFFQPLPPLGSHPSHPQIKTGVEHLNLSEES